MPTSDVAQIPFIVACVQIVRPQSVLDLGFGFGKYGFLLREYIDVCAEIGSSAGLDAKDKPGKIRIDGVEGCPEYITPVQRLIYDDVAESNVLEFCGTLPDKQYDCCLLIDVLEHLMPSDGARLLRDMRRVARCAIVTTPKYFYPQGELCGNPLEKHLCVWSRRALKKAGYDLFWPIKNQHLAVSTASPAVRSKLKTLMLHERGRALTPVFLYDAYWRLRYGRILREAL